MKNEMDNYERVYSGLLKELKNTDLSLAASNIGGELLGGGLRIQCLGTPYIISHNGIMLLDGSDAEVSVRIVLCHYVLQAGAGDLADHWVSYRDFKDSAFFMANFQTNVEEKLARHFAGKPGGLGEAAARLGGALSGDFPGCDVCCLFQALPRIPVLLVFYDRDDDFPASCRLLFDKSAELWLDMECLAVLGSIIAHKLTGRTSHL